MTSEANVISRPRRGGSLFAREVNSLFIALIVGVSTYILLKWATPQVTAQELHPLLEKFVGVSWPFFVAVMIFLYYVIGAWIVELFALGTSREWSEISDALHWATEACPLVGLLTTFLSLLLALLVYGEAGPGKPDTQAAFITQFAIAFGSSIAGGILALVAFTLHRVIPQKSLED
jgi:hypothetical protein